MIFPRIASLSLAFAGILISPAFATVTIDWVTVGDAGNAADPLTGRGAVANEYRI